MQAVRPQRERGPTRLASTFGISSRRARLSLFAGAEERMLRSRAVCWVPSARGTRLPRTRGNPR
eukprot:9404499-Pyramimonas_sp.AAC.1